MGERRRTETGLDPGAASDDPLPTPGAVEMLQRHLAHVASEAAAIRVTDYEDPGGPPIADLDKRADSLLTSALEALDVIARLFGGNMEDAPAVSDDTTDGDAPDSASLVPGEVEGLADVVVLARMDLRSRRRVVRGLGPSSSRVEHLAATASALRTIQKSLSAVDRAFSAGLDMPVSVNFYKASVEQSLEVRRRYVTLHKRVLQTGAPRGAEVRTRLIQAGNVIAKVLGSRVAAHLRPGDRALLMLCQSRLREWLTGDDGQPLHAAGGARLWQDLANISTMFLDVNKREELVRHDSRLARETLRELPSAGAAWGEAERAAVHKKLQIMGGRSPAIDALLDAPAEAMSADALRGALEDLDQTLTTGSGSSPEAEPPSSGRRPIID